MAKLVGGGRLDSTRRHLRRRLIWFTRSLRFGLRCRTVAVAKLGSNADARYFVRIDHRAVLDILHGHRGHPEMAGHRVAGIATVGETGRSSSPTSSASSTRPLTTQQKLHCAAAAVDFRNLTVFHLKRLITNLGMSFARCAYPMKGQDMVRALFFHFTDGATDELFTDSWTKRTTKEMLDDLRCISGQSSRDCRRLLRHRGRRRGQGGRTATRRKKKPEDPQQLHQNSRRVRILVQEVRRLASTSTSAASSASLMPQSAFVQLDDVNARQVAPPTRRRERP